MESIVIPQSVIALTFYALWAIVLVVMILADRALLLVSGKVQITDFPAGTPHGSDSYWRINRAHVNTVENLPVFAALVLAGWVAGLDSATFNMLAMVTVGARVAQSLVHIASGSALAINLRFSALLVQLVCEVWMGVLIFQAAKLF
ncbi:MAG TPA: MAPEG family protein [Rhizomicrobium sp.]|nr:MAPEG family protein [Rhizomicrobium sp.]